MPDYARLNRLFNRIVLCGFYGALALLMLMVPLSCLGLYWLLSWGCSSVETEIADPAACFTDHTGLPWPGAARLILAEDSYGGWRGKGDVFIVFDADRRTLADWLAGEPPWEVATWEHRGVPPELARHLQHRFASFEDAVQADTVTYCAKDRTSGEALKYMGPWRSAQFLAIDVAQARVYLLYWSH
jgi:hypothetical protein